MANWKMGVLLAGVGLLGWLGCAPPNGSGEGQPKGSPSGIIGKSTQEIGEFDPNAGQQVSEGKMKPTSPLNPLGAMNAYQPTIEKLAKMQIQQAVNLFQAAEGRYPKSHEEFMSAVIRANQIRLPQLPGDWQYQYDVESHELVVVRPPADEQK